MNAEKKVAVAISYLFHPMFMPLAGMAFMLWAGSYLSLVPFEAKRAILLILALGTIFLPLTVLPFMYYQQLITHYTIPKRSERLLPLFLTTAFYLFSYFTLRHLGVPAVLNRYIFAATICVFFASVIHLKWKISLHTMGLGGVTGLISYFGHVYGINIFPYLIPVIIVSGLVGSARLVLEEHSQNEVYSGFLLAFVITFAIMFAGWF
jgi:hypothetical protein